jgi:hypothetical protein
MQLESAPVGISSARPSLPPRAYYSTPTAGRNGRSPAPCTAAGSVQPLNGVALQGHYRHRHNGVDGLSNSRVVRRQKAWRLHATGDGSAPVATRERGLVALGTGMLLEFMLTGAGTLHSMPVLT